MSSLLTPKNWTHKVHCSHKPIIWSCDLFPQVGHRILAHLQSFLCALINDPQKKKCRASTRAHDTFFDILKIWPTFIYRGEVPSHTFAKLPVHALINDPKKMFRKKLYVTIPQWFETFPNMSDLWPGRNRAKCGLQLNDPIDWLKLRLSQPTKNCPCIYDFIITITHVFCCSKLATLRSGTLRHLYKLTTLYMNNNMSLYVSLRYISSISLANRFRRSILLVLKVGVRSPFSTENSSGWRWMSLTWGILKYRVMKH